MDEDAVVTSFKLFLDMLPLIRKKLFQKDAVERASALKASGYLEEVISATTRSLIAQLD